jgi:1-acyl-sn-glycerol-3-phosphate acyltransferase
MGNVLALSNMVVFISILLSAVAFALLDLFFRSNEIFLIIGTFALVVSLGVLVLDPISILRLIIKGITKLLYKTKVSGFQNIPQNKGAIIVVNHVSMLDSLVVLNAINKNVRFVMHDAVYHQKRLNPLFKRCKMIPVSSGKSKSALQDFTFRVKKEIDLGHLVCIFPEGQLGRTGQLMPFKKGIEMLVKLTGAPVLPMHIQGMIGSPLSYKIGENKRYTFHPKNWRKEIRVEVGSLIEVKKNECITAFEIRQTVKELEVVNINNLIKKKDKSKVLKQTVDALFGFSNNLKLNSNNAFELILQSPNYILKDLMKKENLYLGTKEGTAGKPIPGVQVKVLKKNLSHCKENEIGELHVLNAYSENFKWINTSCLGSIDECGFVTICNEVQL